MEPSISTNNSVREGTVIYESDNKVVWVSGEEPLKWWSKIVKLRVMDPSVPSLTQSLAELMELSKTEKGKYIQPLDKFKHKTSKSGDGTTQLMLKTVYYHTTLKDFLIENGPLSEDQCMSYLFIILKCLAKVHQSSWKYHGNLKASNVFMDKD